MYCRVCKLNSLCEHILTIENQPFSAQQFFESQSDSQIKVDLEIYECAQCGLVQHNLEPVDYYKDVIRAVAYSLDMKQFRLKQFQSFLNNYELYDKNILEIGSGKGEYLDLLHESGAKKLFGLENSLKNFNVLREKKYNSQKGFLDSSFANNWGFSFDAIVSFNFVEHWPDLLIGLTKMKNLLLNDGIALIEVPNFRYMLKNGIYTEFTVDHIYYFTEESLRIILQNVGFEIISINSVWKDYILSAIVRRRQKANIISIYEKKQKNTRNIIDYLSNYRGSIVIWGAGHQALSIMAMIRADRYVKYVVDSAPFKQGKFCPVTGLKIFSPSQLNIDCPKCIVVMGAGYTDEIVNIIKRNFNNISDILIANENGIRKPDDK